MGSKNRSKKRSSKSDKTKTGSVEILSIENAGDLIPNMQNEENKVISKTLPFASISNKQFQNLGLVPSKRQLNQVKTIPLRFSSKLMPMFKRIFNLGKIDNNDKVKSNDMLDKFDNFITLISFQTYVQTGNQIKLCPSHFPTLQITRVPVKNSEPLMGLYLSETSIKTDLMQPVSNKTPIPSIENKVTKKRSFFNEIWRKKPTNAICETAQAVVENKEIFNKPIPLPYAPLKPPVSNNDLQLSLTSNITNHVSLDNCIICKKTAFIAERIQIGADIFHNLCFKCYQCSKSLYRGKWNKHQEQYLCDNCSRKCNWSFIRK